MGCPKLSRSVSGYLSRLRLAVKNFQMPALSALSALFKAKQGAVQLWETVHFRGIISALHLHYLHFLPPSGPIRG